MRSVVEFWNDFDVYGLHLVRHKDHTGTMRTILEIVEKLMAGTFFDDKPEYPAYQGRKFTYEEITQVISNFGKAAFDPLYEPRYGYKKHLRHVRMPQFFYNRFRVSRRSEKSLFLKYLENPPKKLDERALLGLRSVPDDYPDITKVLLTWYVEERFGGCDARLTYVERNDLRRAAKRLHDAYLRMRERLIDEVRNPRSFAKLAISAVAKEVKYRNAGSRVTPGWFNDGFFNRTLPAYLNTQAMFKEGDNRFLGFMPDDD